MIMAMVTKSPKMKIMKLKTRKPRSEEKFFEDMQVVYLVVHLSANQFYLSMGNRDLG